VCTDHEDPALVEAVRKGRRAEFASFAWEGEMPDPQNPDTFEHSRVHPGIQTLVEHNQILRWYHRLITLRKSILPLESAQSSQHEHRVWIEESEQVLFLYRTLHRQRAALIIRTPTG
jgi:maltooligosyltrehalose trehalohydrolase